MKFWFGWMLMGSLVVFAVTGCQDDGDRDRTSPPPAAWDLSGNWQVREAFCEETAAGVNLSAEEFDATLLEFEQGMDDYLWVRNVHGNFPSQRGSVSGDQVSFAFGPVQWNPKANLVVAGVSFNGSVVREGRIEGNFEVSFSSGERATCGAGLDRLEEPAVDHSGDWVLVEGSDVTCTLDLGGWGDPEAEAVRLKDRLEAASTGASSVWQLVQDPEGNAIRGLKYGLRGGMCGRSGVRFRGWLSDGLRRRQWHLLLSGLPGSRVGRRQGSALRPFSRCRGLLDDGYGNLR